MFVNMRNNKANPDSEEVWNHCDEWMMIYMLRPPLPSPAPGTIINLQNWCFALKLASVSPGEKSISIVGGDELNRLW